MDDRDGRLNEFGARLRSLMDGRGMTVRDVSDSAGVSTNTVASALRGDRYPTLWTLIRLRDALGCSWDDLLGGDTCRVRVAHPDVGGFHEYVCGTMRMQFKYRGDLNHCPICGRRADVRS